MCIRDRSRSTRKGNLHTTSWSLSRGPQQPPRISYPWPSPSSVSYTHLPELPWGTVGLDPGAVNASCDAVEITVEGEPTHGAYPHLGRDPILALAQIVVALHAQVARRIDPHGPAVLTVGVLEGGAAENVIPPRARARAALRAHRPEDRLALRQMVQEVVTGIEMCIRDRPHPGGGGDAGAFAVTSE